MTDVDRELSERFGAAYDENGVDRSQIRQRLRLSPEQRLSRLEQAIDALGDLRNALRGSHDELSGDTA